MGEEASRFQRPAGDPVDLTLATYETKAADYAARNRGPYPAVIAFLDRLAELTGPGCVLELGSGPGRDADHLETRGVSVIRTDATEAFLAMMRAAGHEAQHLDIRHDDFGGPYDAVLADAVLLHLPEDQLSGVLRRLRGAVRGGGLLAFTLKEGDGAKWTRDKLGAPRYFVYWREPALRDVLAAAGWKVQWLEHTRGPADDWLQVIAS